MPRLGLDAVSYRPLWFQPLAVQHKLLISRQDLTTALSFLLKCAKAARCPPSPTTLPTRCRPRSAPAAVLLRAGSAPRPPWLRPLPPASCQEEATPAGESEPRKHCEVTKATEAHFHRLFRPL